MVKALGSTEELPTKLHSWSPGEGSGIPSVAVKCVDIGRNTLAKAATWTGTDAEARKRGEQTGLDTLVLHAVNDGHLVLRVSTPAVPKLTH